MAAYAAVVSLNFMIHQVQQSALKKKPHLESLQEKVNFRLDFLEKHSHQEIQDLESEIRDVAYEAQDVIESRVLDQILLKPGTDEEKKSSLLFSEHLQNVMEKFDSIEGKAIKIVDGELDEDQQLLRSASCIPGGPSRSAPSVVDNTTMIGFDAQLIEVMDRLTSQGSNLHTLPVVGMGGIGKTTLIQHVFDKPFIKEHFQIRLWATISQSYNVQNIFLGLLHELGLQDGKIKLELMSLINKASPESSNQLGDVLYKTLSGRRYLVVMDDIWSVRVWNMIRRFFPNNGNGSRIVVTTRLLNVASYIGSLDPYTLDFLDEQQSWNLLKQKVFAQDGCPRALDAIGRKIALSCKGLPLAIVLVGGQLVKSDMTKEYWEYVAGAMNSLVNSENDDHCLKVLSLSYDNLPVYLKPCFLFMGAYPEDSEVRVSRLVKFWVAEGFCKPSRDKCLEDTAMEYLTDLVERNLFLVSKRGSSGKAITCKIHDLLRDLCLRKAHEENFLRIRRSDSNHKRSRNHPSILNPLRSTSIEFSALKLLSEFDVADVNSPKQNLLFIGSRVLVLSANHVMEISASSKPLASLSMFWNLQSLIMSQIPGNEPVVLPPKIWKMPLLKHVEIQRIVLPNPPISKGSGKGKDHSVLLNLQTLLDVRNFILSEEVLKRILNLKKLKITYRKASRRYMWSRYCLNNLVQLCKLESLSVSVNKEISTVHISFPLSLKKLTLDGCKIPWEDITVVGSLPNLEVLRLHNDAFCGREWRPVVGEFCRLKSLQLRKMSLEIWEAEAIHFPRLESLILCDVMSLKEIPLDIGDIATLKLISLELCSTSLVLSAKQLQEDLENMGNSGITVIEPIESAFGRMKQMFLEESPILTSTRAAVMELEEHIYQLKASLLHDQESMGNSGFKALEPTGYLFVEESSILTNTVMELKENMYNKLKAPPEADEFERNVPVGHSTKQLHEDLENRGNSRTEVYVNRDSNSHQMDTGAAVGHFTKQLEILENMRNSRTEVYVNRDSNSHQIDTGAAAAAVEVLIDSLKQLVLYHRNLIIDDPDVVVKLNKDLHLLKAFLREEQGKGQRLSESESQIRDLVDATVDIISTFIIAFLGEEQGKGQRLSETVSQMRDLVYATEDIIDTFIIAFLLREEQGKVQRLSETVSQIRDLMYATVDIINTFIIELVPKKQVNLLSIRKQVGKQVNLLSIRKQVGSRVRGIYGHKSKAELCNSLVFSAKQVQEEQESMGNSGITVIKHIESAFRQMKQLFLEESPALTNTSTAVELEENLYELKARLEVEKFEKNMSLGHSAKQVPEDQESIRNSGIKVMERCLHEESHSLTDTGTDQELQEYLHQLISFIEDKEANKRRKFEGLRTSILETIAQENLLRLIDLALDLECSETSQKSNKRSKAHGRSRGFRLHHARDTRRHYQGHIRGHQICRCRS